MKLPVLTLLSFCACACWASPQPGAPANFGIVRFASPDGSPTNDGLTPATPLSVGAALAQANASMIIKLLPGTYPSIEITRPGTRLVSQPKWAAVVVGSPGVDGIWADPGVANVTLDGLQVAQSSGDGIKLQGPNCTVRNCWVHDSTANGVSVRGQFKTFLERNLVENNGTGGTGHGLNFSGTNCVARANVLRYNQGWGCQIFELAPGSSAECCFYNNLVYGNKNGLTIWSSAGQTNYVFNNTIISSTNYCLIADFGNLCLSNNILGAMQPSLVIGMADNANVFSDYNLFNATPTLSGQHDLVAADPAFVNPASGLYWLIDGSPASFAANPALVPPVDFFGKAQTSVTAAGAFQFSSALAADTRVLDPSPTNGADYWATLSAQPNPPSI